MTERIVEPHLETMQKHKMRSIGSCTAACTNLFLDIIAILSAAGATDLFVSFRDQLGRFHIWASSSGATASHHASLDYRLRDLDEAVVLFTEQLGIIERRLAEYLSGTKTKHDEASLHPPSTIPTDLSNVEQSNLIISVISESIGWLQKLWNTVRRAGSASQNQEASSFKIAVDGVDDIGPLLEDAFSKLIKREFPATSKEIVERIARAMVLRRRRIEYRSHRHRRRHANKEVTKRNAAQQPPAPMPQDNSNESQDPTESAPPIDGSGAGDMDVQNASVSASVHTTLNREAFQRQLAPSRISRASTIALSDEVESVPIAPKVPDGDLDFICPYCCFILPVEIGRDRKKWTEHVKKDLDPYVCMAEVCELGHELFSTSREWISHMRNEHLTRWRCLLKSHEPLTFETQVDFKNHMREVHPGRFSETRLQSAADTSGRPFGPTFESCPLCGTEDKNTNFHDHVGQHLHNLALMSLPLPGDFDGDAANDSEIDSRSDSNSKVQSRSTLREFEASHDPLVVDEPSGDTRQQDDAEVQAYWSPASFDDFVIQLDTIGRASQHVDWGYKEFVADQALIAQEQRRDPSLKSFIELWELAKNVPAGTTVKRLAVTLEDLFTGETQKVRYWRRVPVSKSSNNGLTIEQAVLDVPIPRGLGHGSRIKFGGEGDFQPEAGKMGELWFIIVEKEHPLFKRKGEDLHAAIDTTLLSALTGRPRSVQSIDGVSVSVGDGKPIAPADSIAFPGLGMPRYGRHDRGDLCIKPNIIYPRNLTGWQKELLSKAFPDSQKYR